MSGAFPKVIYEEYYVIAHTYMYKYKYIYTSLFALLTCIPVGCVPAARRPYSGVCFPGWGSAWSGGTGGLPWSGVGLPGQGGSPWSGGVGGVGVSLGPGGILPWSGGFCLVRGGSPCPGGVLPAWRLPPVDRITDTCKNITLATTSLRPVINLLRTERLNRTHSNRNHIVNLFSFHFRVLTWCLLLVAKSVCGLECPSFLGLKS